MNAYLKEIELLRVHGLKKFKGNNGKPEVVPDPLHLPQWLNNAIATFSDTVVPGLLIMGLFTRLAVLPTIGVTSIGYFVIHRHDPVTVRDIPYMYTICMLLVLVTGPGTISLDDYLYHHFF